MKFINRQFGELEFEEKHIVHFPHGIIGFEYCKKFIVVNDEETEPFGWLVSVEDEEVSFPLLEPSVLLPYYVEKIEKGEDVTIFIIATLRENVEESTVNLRSPIVIDNKTQTGEQIIVEDESLSMRYPLIPTTQQFARE